MQPTGRLTTDHKPYKMKTINKDAALAYQAKSNLMGAWYALNALECKFAKDLKNEVFGLQKQAELLMKAKTIQYRNGGYSIEDMMCLHEYEFTIEDVREWFEGSIAISENWTVAEEYAPASSDKSEVKIWDFAEWLSEEDKELFFYWHQQTKQPKAHITAL